ncbi:uncharacterized protein LOC126279521 [Schistocerca gregaria]|uniref:uncharacterized protein LOC126279521 n=1 Tax=Schistocerca gregaria TaxID=7010 RepID=UPI00211DE194|nr:uncharacterized protein LOC126279521 [Schistocerca gregaria]
MCIQRELYVVYRVFSLYCVLYRCDFCSVVSQQDQEKNYVSIHGQPSIPADSVVERTSKTLGISARTVVSKGVLLQNLEDTEVSRNASELSGSNNTFLSTPGKKKKRPSPITGLDSFQADAVRRHVYAYYSRKEYSTVAKLLISLKESELFRGGKTSLKNCAKNMGFCYKTLDGRKVLLERAHIVTARSIFLHKIVGRDIHSIIWLDETWVNAGEAVSKCWTDNTPISSGHQPTGRGARLIVVHAGSSSGFVPEALLVFRSKKTGDYHEDMDHTRFVEWFRNLLKQFPVPTTMVMGNAPYHSVIQNKAPTTNDWKEVMVQWLQARNIVADMSMTKVLLYSLVKENKRTTPTYVVDKIAKEQGHTVIRLPPYHCHFNPIELVWSDVKMYLRNKKKSFTITEVEQLLREALVTVDAASWRKKVEHIEKLIRAAQTIEGIISGH